MPSELTPRSVCDLVTGRRKGVATPAGATSAADRADFDRHFNEHPLVRHHTVECGGDAHRLSDLVPLSRFRNSALNSDDHRRVGTDHVIAVPLYVDERLLVSFVPNRSRRDFSNREREQLDALAGSLGQLYRQAQALDRARELAPGLDHMPGGGAIGSIRLGPCGRVREFSPRAAEQAQRLWGVRLRRGALLPAELNDGLALPLRCAPIASALPPRESSTGSGCLTLHADPAIDAGGGLLALLDERPDDSQPPAGERWNLSAREREVMHWLAAGKTDGDIGAILGISPRTVHKHLQRRRIKLGVETRAAAVMRRLGSR